MGRRSLVQYLVRRRVVSCSQTGEAWMTNPSHRKYTFKRLQPPLTQHTFAVSAFDAAGNESGPSVLTK
jgi:hypothetical protein